MLFMRATNSIWLSTFVVRIHIRVQQPVLQTEKTYLSPTGQYQQDNCSAFIWWAERHTAPSGELWDRVGAVVPKCRCIPQVLPEASDRADSSPLAVHTKVRCTCRKYTWPLCNPPIWLILPIIESFRLTTKAEGDASLRSASFGSPFLFYSWIGTLYWTNYRCTPL